VVVDIVVDRVLLVVEPDDVRRSLFEFFPAIDHGFVPGGGDLFYSVAVAAPADIGEGAFKDAVFGEEFLRTRHPGMVYQDQWNRVEQGIFLG
jgi:hypothetical protein